MGIGRVLVLEEEDWTAYGEIVRRAGMSIERRWPGVTLCRSNRPASLVMARTGSGHGCGDWTPVPARRDGLTGVRLLAAAAAGASLRVELPDSSGWVSDGAMEFRYAAADTYERNYILGALLLLLVFGWPLGRAAQRLAARRPGRPRDPKQPGREARE